MARWIKLFRDQYLGFWALYFAGHQSLFVMMLFIVALPPL